MILYTSDTNNLKITYIITTLFILLFSLVYENFSHGVMSINMLTAFIYPIIGYILISRKKTNVLTINLVNMSVITLTLYNIMKGVLDIYGTTNNLINIYLYIGIILVICTVISLIIKKGGGRK